MEDVCHGHPVKDDEVYLQILKIEKDVEHRLYRYPIEKDSFAALSFDCIAKKVTFMLVKMLCATK